MWWKAVAAETSCGWMDGWLTGLDLGGGYKMKCGITIIVRKHLRIVETESWCDERCGGDDWL